MLVAMVTHEGPERAVTDALAGSRDRASLLGAPMMMHILDV